MNYSVAQAARTLADWQPNVSEQGTADAEAVRALLDEQSGFRRTLLNRLRWACKFRPDISSRFPVDPWRSPQTVDEDLLGDLAQEIVMLLLKPGKPFGSRNAFGVLRDRMDKEGAGDWTDADCLVFLLGKKDVHYDLPRPKRRTGACPAIWLWVAMHWRPRSQRQQESHFIFRRRVPRRSQTEVDQRGIDQEKRLPGGGELAAEDLEADMRRAIAMVHEWPAEQRRLLVEALRPGAEILKTATIERLRTQETKYPKEVARCFSVSAVSRFLGLERRAAENEVRELARRLLSLPIGPDSTTIEVLKAALGAGAAAPPTGEASIDAK